MVSLDTNMLTIYSIWENRKNVENKGHLYQALPNTLPRFDDQNSPYLHNDLGPLILPPKDYSLSSSSPTAHHAASIRVSEFAAILFFALSF